jgi:hypothetical protein
MASRGQAFTVAPLLHHLPRLPLWNGGASEALGQTPGSVLEWMAGYRCAYGGTQRGLRDRRLRIEGK